MSEKRWAAADRMQRRAAEILYSDGCEGNSGPGGPFPRHPIPDAALSAPGGGVWERITDGVRETYTVSRDAGRVRVQYAIDAVDTDQPVVHLESGVDGWLASLIARWLADGYTRVGGADSGVLGGGPA